MALARNDRAALSRLAKRKWIEKRLRPWCPHKPTEKQLDALISKSFELFFGGAMGGGKSDCTLMDALLYVHIKGYQALVLRRSLKESDRMGAILDRAKSWWTGRKGVEFDGKTNTFTFNGRGKITFGYLRDLGDEAQYDSTEIQRVYWEELQDFEWSQYSYLFQRIRGGVSINVPWAMRSTGMPGGVGQDWVRERFIEKKAPDATKPWIPENDNARPAFVPSVAGDNPHLSGDYEKLSLANLDPFTRASRGKGDWSVTPDGNLFRREFFPIVDALPQGCAAGVRFYDFGASEKKRGSSPDPSACVRMHFHAGVYFISHADEAYLSPADTDGWMQRNAVADGLWCAIRWEEELGASGPQLTNVIKRHVLPSSNADGVKVSGDKVTRAKPVSAAAEKRMIFLVRGAWNEMYITRMCGFPVGKRDVTDATSGAFHYLQANQIGAPVPHRGGQRTLTSTLWSNRRSRAMR